MTGFPSFSYHDGRLWTESVQLERVALEFGGETFVRPPQGESEKREGW